MDDYNMDPDITIGSVTIRSILSNKDLLSHPMISTCTDKDKDYNDVYTDASAAFLGPNIWDKNLSEFKMDYLDLDALLSGNDDAPQKGNDCNGINTNEKVPHHHHHHQQQQQQQQQQHHHQQQHHLHQHHNIPAQDAPNLVPVNDYNEVNTSEKVPRHHHHHHDHQQHHHHHHHYQQHHLHQRHNIPAQDSSNLVPVQSSRHMASQPSSPLDSSSLSEMSKDGDGRLYSIDCKFSPTDLALATPPGQEHYDPASTVFPEEELKPQPIIKKSRKNFVPDNMKDDKYWARRHKNNIAAKRSREARRLKENQIVLRASYLEKENNSLKEDVMRLKAENDMLKSQLKEFQS